MLINGVEVYYYFDIKEFSENPELYAHSDLLTSLVAFRKLLAAQIYPSPVPGALARFDNEHGSLHNVYNAKNVGVSKAIDVFCNTSIFRAWTIALESKCFNGIGAYFDTKYKDEEWPMLHLDKRDNPLIWFRDEGKYYYHFSTKDFYYKLLNRFLVYDNKTKRSV